MNADNIRHSYLTAVRNPMPCSRLPPSVTRKVGDEDYLLAQLGSLGSVPSNLKILKNSKKHHFAKPYPELLAIYEELIDAGIEFDLIYGALMWQTLLQHMDRFEGTVLYVHSGGLIGNETMLARYRYQGMM